MDDSNLIPKFACELSQLASQKRPSLLEELGLLIQPFTGQQQRC